MLALEVRISVHTWQWLKNCLQTAAATVICCFTLELEKSWFMMAVVKIHLSCCLGQPTINKELTLKDIYSVLGNPANVMCLVSNPHPVHFKWTKDGEEVHDSENVKVHSNILVVTPRQPKDFGVYVCHMSNIAGKDNYRVELVQLSTMNISCKYAASFFCLLPTGYK